MSQEPGRVDLLGRTNPAPANNGAIVAMLVSFVPVVPGVRWLNRSATRPTLDARSVTAAVTIGFAARAPRVYNSTIDVNPL